MKVLRAEISRDVAEVRRRWRSTRDRVPREWREIRDAARDVLELFGVLLRRRTAPEPTPPAARDSTPRAAEPSPR